MSEIFVPVEERNVVSLWRNRNMLLMVTSVASSGFADRMVQLAAWSMLGYYLAGAQASSIQAGVSFFFFLPYVLFCGVFGWMADTFSRKWLLLIADEGRALVLLVAMLLAPAGAAVAIGSEHHWKVYAIMFVAGTFAALFAPAKAATVPQIVPLQQLQPANAMVLGISVIASLLGFVVGEPIILKMSAQAGLTLGTVTYGITGFLFLFLVLRRREGEHTDQKQSEWTRLIDAARYTWRHRAVLELTLLSVLFWGAANVLVACIAAVCRTQYADPNSSAPLMMATMGAGMMVSSLWIAWMNTRKESAWFTMISLIIVALGMVAYGLNRSYALGLVLVVLIGFFGNTAMICVATLTQSIAPDYIRGRVFGVRELINTFSAVAVNLIIWRMPHADSRMVPALNFVALSLLIVACYGLWTQMISKPFDSWAINFYWRVVRAYTLVWHRVRWIGRENIPLHGPVILAANHTSGIDPFIMQSACPRVIRWLMVETYRIRILEPIFWKYIQPISIAQGDGDLPMIRKIVRTAQSGEIVGIFPEGSIDRDRKLPEGQLQPFESGVGLIAVRSHATIIPVWIEGTPKSQSMAGYFLRPSRSVVVYGKGYKPDKNHSLDDVAQDLKARIEELGRQWRATQENDA